MTDERVDTIVLREFRLASADTDGAVARIVDAMPAGAEPAVPLLTSIDDRHDVATIRALRAGEPEASDAAQRTVLDPFVTDWQPTKRYQPRMAEHSQSPPTRYRLAVTESGINDERPDPPTDAGDAPEAAFLPVDLLWIGRPLASHAGLLILLGTHDDPRAPVPDPPDAGVWPLAMSRGLGVRIYEGRT